MGRYIGAPPNIELHFVSPVVVKLAGLICILTDWVTFIFWSLCGPILLFLDWCCQLRFKITSGDS